MNKTIKNLITFVALATLPFLTVGEVYADGQYGKEVVNKSFRIEKSVRVKDRDESFVDKLMLDFGDKDRVLEFKVKIKNTGELKVNHMKMEDFLPDELERVGGDGLTEYWGDFEPGEIKTFYIDAKVNSSEFDRENFEKCVVNKAEVRYSNKFEGADTATVCYGMEKEEEITELPETGFVETLLPVGLGLLAVGYALKRYKEEA